MVGMHALRQRCTCSTLHAFLLLTNGKYNRISGTTAPAGDDNRAGSPPPSHIQGTHTWRAVDLHAPSSKPQVKSSKCSTVFGGGCVKLSTC